MLLLELIIADGSLPLIVTGDEEVGVIDGLLLELALKRSFVAELSLLIEVDENQFDERKDLKKDEKNDRISSRMKRRTASVLGIYLFEKLGEEEAVTNEYIEEKI